MDPLDLYGNKKEFEKKFEKAKEQKINEIKQDIKKILPEPIGKMLDTPEGTYALISIAVVIFIMFLKMIGMTLKFFLKLILFISILAAAYFLYLYFYG